jgi:hypothetical protein
MSDSERSHVLMALTIERSDSGRFTVIPRFDSPTSFEWMREFIESITDNEIRSQCTTAISRRKPFRQFRDAVAADRGVERQWDVFHAARQRETMIDWLGSIGSEPSNPESAMGEPLPLPNLRKIMFAEVRRFARDMDGVQRIAVIGSLTTDKEFPAGVELLVTVAGNCNLRPLAELGRQLRGHLLTHSAGSDVYLANEEGEYLGRICAWKKCRPGVRMSCHALHCGQRQYLYDDLQSVRLEKDEVAEPPILLWPNLSVADGVPSDALEQLIVPLGEDASR